MWRTGIARWNVVPLPSVLSTLIAPPSDFTIWLTSASPTPVLLQRFVETAFVAQSLAPLAQSDNLSERIMFLVHCLIYTVKGRIAVCRLYDTVGFVALLRRESCRILSSAWGNQHGGTYKKQTLNGVVVSHSRVRMKLFHFISTHKDNVLSDIYRGIMNIFEGWYIVNNCKSVTVLSFVYRHFSV